MPTYIRHNSTRCMLKNHKMRIKWKLLSNQLWWLITTLMRHKKATERMLNLPKVMFSNNQVVNIIKKFVLITKRGKETSGNKFHGCHYRHLYRVGSIIIFQVKFVPCPSTRLAPTRFSCLSWGYEIHMDRASDDLVTAVYIQSIVNERIQ